MRPSCEVFYHVTIMRGVVSCDLCVCADTAGVQCRHDDFPGHRVAGGRQ